MLNAGRLVIALSGRTKAGKSTVARALGERLQWPWASFGEFVRAEAQRRGRSDDREHLQDVGSELIASLGWEQFCAETLAHAGLGRNSVPCIVEGVRHVDAVATLRKMFVPTPVYLVHLDVSDQERERRLRVEGISRDRGGIWELHSTERDVAEALPALADLRVNVADSPEMTVNAIVAWLDAP